MSSTCSVSTTTLAPAGGTIATLSAGSSPLTVPPSIAIAAGFTAASFTTTAGAFPADTTATITASANGSTGAAQVSLLSQLATMTFQQGSGGYIGGEDNMVASATSSTAYPIGGARSPNLTSAKFCSASCENMLLRFKNVAFLNHPDVKPN
jgi:hypothetical protein